MTDIFDKNTRSRIMSSIKSKNTKIEWKLRKYLWNDGYRYRIHYPIVGKPDIVFPTARIAIFVDGDYWHGFDWETLRKKLKNRFWKNKILSNIKRDKRVNNELIRDNWTVLRFWEHEINNNIDKCIARIKELIR